jgi:cellobiose phosphorylase
MQQNIMLAYGLYDQGFVKEGHEVFSEVYQLAVDTEHAKIFPGVPSYFNNENKGSYAWLTGSSSWLLLSLTTQIFGVKGEKGDLCLSPKLVKDQFNEEGKAGIMCNFQNRRLKVNYHNPNRKDFEEYGISEILIDGETVGLDLINDKKVVIKKEVLDKMKGENGIEITVKLT